MLIGGDVVQRAQAQQAADPLYPTPVAFSFGWVAYAFSSLLAIAGDNRLMPQPDTSCVVINAKTGYTRQNTSWVLGRLVRDFEVKWMPVQYRAMLKDMLQTAGRQKGGLCVSVFEASSKLEAGDPPMKDAYWWSGYLVALVQLGIAAIPLAIHGNWEIITVTAGGTILAFTSGSLPQWRHELRFGRKKTEKTVILTRGNGAQHAMVIIGAGRGLDLEDLAAPSEGVTLTSTRVVMPILGILWVALLITVSGVVDNTWYLILIGSIGMIHTAIIAAAPRHAECYGIHLVEKDCILDIKVMKTLMKVEEKYPGVGKAMLPEFFAGTLRKDEEAFWEEAEERLKRLKKEKSEKKDEKSPVS
jgi:hypothetical protein